MTDETLLRQCFTDALGVPPDQITDVLGPYAVPPWDSIGHMALIAELERVFSIELSPDDVVALNNLAAARTIVTTLRSQPATRHESQEATQNAKHGPSGHSTEPRRESGTEELGLSGRAVYGDSRGHHG